MKITIFSPFIINKINYITILYIEPFTHFQNKPYLIKIHHSWKFLLWLSELRTQLVSMKVQAQSPAWLSGLRILSCCKLLCRSTCVSDPAKPWLWHRLAAAALNQPFRAAGMVLKRKEKKKIYHSFNVLLNLFFLRAAPEA